MPGRRKYPLIVYRHMMNRWWPPMITMGLVMFVLAYSEYTSPIARFIPSRWQLCAGIGVLAILVGLFLIILLMLLVLLLSLYPSLKPGNRDLSLAEHEGAGIGIP